MSTAELCASACPGYRLLRASMAMSDLVAEIADELCEVNTCSE